MFRNGREIRTEKTYVWVFRLGASGFPTFRFGA